MEIVLFLSFCFLMLVVPFRYLIVLFQNDDKGGFYKLAHVLALLLICLALLALIDVFTVEPTKLSGNSNPGLFIVIPYVLILTIYITSLFLFVKEAVNYIRRFKGVLIVLLIGVTLFCLLQTGQLAADVLTVLGGDPEQPSSKIYQFSWLNQYTNNLYFNVYTFSLLTSVTILCTLPFAKQQNS